LLAVDRVMASPIPTGGGFIEIAHGRVSVPAPATAELLTGIPLAESAVQAELTTPTGAAIAATLCESFGPLPAMAVERIGYGAGTRDLAEQPNVLRLLVGTSDHAASESSGGAAAGAGVLSDTVTLFETNVDDITGEAIGYCIERLWQAGALDVTTAAIAMKKNRPGVALSVMCHAADADKIETVLFRETTTLGVRRSEVRRRVLARRKTQVQTPYGPIDGVVADLPGGGEKFSPEYESCRKAAAEHGVSLGEIWKAVGR
jgi:hypothetical protein